MSGIFIVAAKRTPFGAFGGGLAHVTATQLGITATKAALQSGNVDPNIVDAVFFGNVIQTGRDAAYVARHVALASGMKLSTPALTINRLCGSGFETVIQAAQGIKLGEQHVVLAGGTENMSAAPLVVDGTTVRFGQGIALGKGMQLRDALWDGLTDAYVNTPMGMTAENLAKQYNISRADCDAFAIRSQQNWAAANSKGVFQAEMAPVTVPDPKKKKKHDVVIDTDEHPRPESTVEKIGKLPSVFIQDGTGVVTAANASGICDGAGAIIVASEQAVHEHNLKPLARIVSYGVVGCDPKIMGIGPVPAIQQALHKAGLTLADMDRIEINEAFAAQTLACAQELQLDMNKLNIHGGAISLGHPLGASGSRIMAHLAHAFAVDPSNARYHLGAACIGGGQGIAVLLERA